MTSILLIYPYFKPIMDRSVFRFPPLGLAYLASSLQKEGYDVHLLDCTFLRKNHALKKALALHADVVGINCMSTMFENCVNFANRLRDTCKLMIAGGPLPTCDPIPFLEYFDVIVQGEGEQTILELLHAFTTGVDFSNIKGIIYQKGESSQKKSGGKVCFNTSREFIKDLDNLPLPARESLPNQEYIQYGKKKYGYSITTIMSTRGCPFQCEFCSNVIFGGSYRERSPKNVVDEIENILTLGYDRVSFADDVFTMKKERVILICDEIIRRGLHFSWECLGRVDSIDYTTALEMKKAGCFRIFFGIESGNDKILQLMKKNITTAQAKMAVEIASRAGIQVGAFFIIFYPGETEENILDTLKFASALPLDYLGLTLPYFLPGTDLLDRVASLNESNFLPSKNQGLNNTLAYKSDFSQVKMKFGILKGHAQFKIKKLFGKTIPIFVTLFEKSTDRLLKMMK